MNVGQTKIWVPEGIQSMSPPNLQAGIYPLSYENSWRARSFTWVYMWRASCILLGSALSKSLWVWCEWLLSLVMKCEKWTDHGTKKSPWQKSNPWPPGHRLGTLSTELQELMESKAIYLSSYVTGIFFTPHLNVSKKITNKEWAGYKLVVKGSIVFLSLSKCCFTTQLHVVTPQTVFQLFVL